MLDVVEEPGRRVAALRAVVCAAFVGSLALSRRVWVGERLYPRLPAYEFSALPAGIEWSLTAGLLAGLVACILGVRVRGASWLVVSCALLLVAADLTRLQPWVYHWTAAVLVLACDPARARERLLWMSSAIYVHSALAKLGDGFASGSFAFMLSPFVDVNELSRSTLQTCAGLSIAAELLLGLALLAPRLRVGAALGLVGMHAFLLLSLGPLGSNWNAVVWPWNAGLVILLPLLAIGDAPRLRVRGNLTLLTLFGLCPLLRPLGLWDHYLSFALYSGDKPRATLYLSDAAHKQLPPALREWARSDVEGQRLSLKSWALGELGVPPYPEVHAYRAVVRRFLAEHPNPYPLELEITVPATFAGRPEVLRETF